MCAAAGGGDFAEEGGGEVVAEGVGEEGAWTTKNGLQQDFKIKILSDHVSFSRDASVD